MCHVHSLLNKINLTLSNCFYLPKKLLACTEPPKRLVRSSSALKFYNKFLNYNHVVLHCDNTVVIFTYEILAHSLFYIQLCCKSERFGRSVVLNKVRNNFGVCFWSIYINARKKALELYSLYSKAASAKHFWCL